MNILVAGCGKVGARLAAMLSAQGHAVSVVDRDEPHFDLLPEDFDGLKTCGIPIDQDVLRQAGIESCDAVAAVSPDDNINIMVSEVARKIFGIENVVTRIYDPDREDVFSHFGLNTVCPTHMTVSAICSAIVEREVPRTLNISSHTVQFKTVPVSPHQIGSDASRVKLPEESAVFAVLHADGSISLCRAGVSVPLAKGDCLVLTELVD